MRLNEDKTRVITSNIEIAAVSLVVLTFKVFSDGMNIVKICQRLLRTCFLVCRMLEIIATFHAAVWFYQANFKGMQTTL